MLFWFILRVIISHIIFVQKVNLDFTWRFLIDKLAIWRRAIRWNPWGCSWVGFYPWRSLFSSYWPIPWLHLDMYRYGHLNRVPAWDESGRKSNMGSNKQTSPLANAICKFRGLSKFVKLRYSERDLNDRWYFFQPVITEILRLPFVPKLRTGCNIAQDVAELAQNDN